MSALSIEEYESDERSMRDHPPPAGVPRINRLTPPPTTEYLRLRWAMLLDAAYMAQGLPRRNP